MIAMAWVTGYFTATESNVECEQVRAIVWGGLL